MKLTNKQIKQMINEVNRDGCAIHSLGFIDLKDFLDI